MMYALLLLLGLTIPTRGWLSPKLISSSRSGDTSSQGEIEPEEEALEKNFNGLISQYDLPMAFDFIEEIFSPKIDVEVIQPRKDFLMLEHHPKACRKTDESKQGTWHRVKRERPKQIHYISHKNATRKHSIAHKNNATEKDNRLEVPQSEPAHKGVIAVDDVNFTKYFCTCYEQAAMGFVLPIVAGLTLILIIVAIIFTKRNGIRVKTGTSKIYHLVNDC